MPLLNNHGRLAPTDVAYELNNSLTIELVWLHILNVLYHVVFLEINLLNAIEHVNTFKH